MSLKTLLIYVSILLQLGSAVYIGIKSYEQFHDILNEAGSKPVFVQFTAPWCSPCVMLESLFEKYSRQAVEEAIFLRVNIDDNKEISGECEITVLPKTNCYKNATLVAENLGGHGDKLRMFIMNNSNAEL